MEQRKSGPKKGAAKKWSERFKQIGERQPPTDLIEKLNRTERPKKIAANKTPPRDLDV